MPGRGDLPPTGFGVALRRERDAKGWTQAQLGDASGIHPNTVAKLERGDQEPAWPVVLALATALGVECTAFSKPQDDTLPSPEVKPGRPPLKREVPSESPSEPERAKGKRK